MSSPTSDASNDKDIDFFMCVILDQFRNYLPVNLIVNFLFSLQDFSRNDFA